MSKTEKLNSDQKAKNGRGSLFRCPRCGYPYSRVMETFEITKCHKMRFRLCANKDCGFLFETVEILATDYKYSKKHV